MANYINLVSLRTTPPDDVFIQTTIKTLTGDNTATLGRVFVKDWVGKKATLWTPEQILAAQNLIDTAPELTARMAGKRRVQAWPPEDKALVAVQLDQFNLIRARLVPPLPPITLQQVIDAVLVKIDVL